MSRSRLTKTATGVVGATIVLLVVYVGWNVGRIGNSLDHMAALEEDTASARTRLDTVSQTDIPAPPEEEMVGVERLPETHPDPDVDLDNPVGQQLPYDPDFAESSDTADEDFDAYLIIGSDQRENLSGARADVIILALLPKTGEAPTLVSLPRDLYLPNPCYRSPTRINAALNGCGDLANGPELLAIMVADYTGIEPDHFALFDFPSFVRVVDTLGGVQVCVGPHPVRDGVLDLPAGCSTVDGEQALAWVRSRKTQELVDGRWRTVAGVNDLTRTERQQDLLMAVFAEVTAIREPGYMATILEELAEIVVVDQGVTLGDAFGIAWEWNGLQRAGVVRLRPDVVPTTTNGGAAVLLPTGPFSQVLDGAAP